MAGSTVTITKMGGPLDTQGTLKTGYFHEWLGASEYGTMVECDSNGIPLTPTHYLSIGSDGEVAYIIQKRATLGNFLSFIRGDAQQNEAFWISKGLGIASLLAAYRAAHPSN